MPVACGHEIHVCAKEGGKDGKKEEEREDERVGEKQQRIQSPVERKTFLWENIQAMKDSYLNAIHLLWYLRFQEVLSMVCNFSGHVEDTRQRIKGCRLRNLSNIFTFKGNRQNFKDAKGKGPQFSSPAISNTFPASSCSCTFASTALRNPCHLCAKITYTYAYITGVLEQMSNIILSM